ncbi:MAG: hypothetical protein D6795_09270 [Deltaproteobacteria bacterium]|nr:MAG: hypothetical protein D6795_09270 [Deltaproteobacteria bacterium]
MSGEWIRESGQGREEEARRITRSWRFHGLGVEIRGPVGIVGHYAEKFRYFPESPPLVDLRFEFETVPRPEDHVVPLPPSHARPVYELPGGAVRYDDHRDILHLGYGEEVRVRSEGRGGRIHFSILAPHEARLWLTAHLFFTLSFMEILKRWGYFSLHAAALAWKGEGVLLAGTSGCGKSTLTLALLKGGFDFLSDDMNYLVSGEKGIEIRALPDLCDLSEETLAFFPELAGKYGGEKIPGLLKRQVRAEEHFSTAVRMSAPPRLLILPRISDREESRFFPLRPAQAFRELVPNVLLTERTSTQAHLDLLARLVERCPVYRLETGRDFDRIPDEIRARLSP